jgi:hypothetical protein
MPNPQLHRAQRAEARGAENRDACLQGAQDFHRRWRQRREEYVVDTLMSGGLLVAVVVAALNRRPVVASRTARRRRQEGWGREDDRAHVMFSEPRTMPPAATQAALTRLPMRQGSTLTTSRPGTITRTTGRPSAGDVKPRPAPGRGRRSEPRNHPVDVVTNRGAAKDGTLEIDRSAERPEPVVIRRWRAG